MKLSVLFAKYLYQNKQLNLPGIGTFQVDKTALLPETADKTTSDLSQHIRFIQQPISRPDDGFIEFIRTHTGKIRPLAESDLESYLEDGKNMLNIGKPFHLEGIGSLHKTKSGIYEFKPGEPLLERFEHATETESDQFRRNKTAYEDRYNTGGNAGIRKLLIAAGIVVFIAAIVWGGYSLYTKKSSDSNVIESESVGTPADTASNAAQPLDTTLTVSPLAAGDDGRYHFIIETTPLKTRAIRRFRQLKSLGVNIQMETADSSFFKLYFDLPAEPKDTSRIKDSLRLRYGSKKVLIEN